MNVLLVFLSLIGLASPWGGGNKVLPLQPMEDPAVVAKLFGPIKYGRGELSKRRACGMDPVASWVYWFYEGDKRRVLVPQRWGKCGGSEGSIRLELYDVEGKRARLTHVSKVYEGITHVGVREEYRNFYFNDYPPVVRLFQEVVLISNGRHSFGQDIGIATLVAKYKKIEMRQDYWSCSDYDYENCLVGGDVSYLLVRDFFSGYDFNGLHVFVVDSGGVVHAHRMVVTQCRGDVLHEMGYSNWTTSALWYGLGRYVREPARMDLHGVQAAEHLALWMHQHHRLWPPQRAALIAWSLWMWHVRPNEAWSGALLALARDLALFRAPGGERRSAPSSWVSAGLTGARAAARR